MRSLIFVRAICVVILAIATFIPLGTIFRWVLIAIAAVVFIVAEVIIEIGVRRRVGTIFLWILITVVVGGFIVTSAMNEWETKKGLEELNQQSVVMKEELKVTKEELEVTNEIVDDLRKKVFQDVAEQVMEAPKEVTPIPTSEPSIKMQIKSPQGGSIVPWRPYVRGTVADPDAEVWVIVRPVDTSAYWVQPSATVSNDGTWITQVYLGRAGDIDVGKQFEIMAVGNPSDVFSEADILGGWPAAQWSSQVVEVTRGWK